MKRKIIPLGHPTNKRIIFRDEKKILIDGTNLWKNNKYSLQLRTHIAREFEDSARKKKDDKIEKGSKNKHLGTDQIVSRFCLDREI